MSTVTERSAPTVAAAAGTLADVDLLLVRHRNATDAAAAVAWLDEHFEGHELLVARLRWVDDDAETCDCWECEGAREALALPDAAALAAISRGSLHRQPWLALRPVVYGHCAGEDDTCDCYGQQLRRYGAGRAAYRRRSITHPAAAGAADAERWAESFAAQAEALSAQVARAFEDVQRSFRAAMRQEEGPPEWLARPPADALGPAPCEPAPADLRWRATWDRLDALEGRAYPTVYPF